MISYYNILEYQDYLEEHADYITLMEEYSDTEIYKEIIHFMDLAFPEWTTNKGLGFWSAEFVFTFIQNFEHLYEEINSSSFDVLKELYINLVYTYKNSKSSFASVISNDILDDFTLEYNEYLEEKEHLPINDFNALYHELYNDFEEKSLEKITYNFTD